MCGIAGVISFSDYSVDKNVLAKMGDTMRMRGPDEETFYTDECLSLIFRRLSIIDVDGGSQPIFNESKDIIAVVNGEIYNHAALRTELQSEYTFKTNSDSEVVLHVFQKYGIQGIEKLNGMFAFAIWDKKEKTLYLARDRLGIKPLYYAYFNDGIMFSSELKALLVHPDCPRTLKWSDLNEPTLQQKEEVSTYIEDIHYLPGGSYAVINEIGMERHDYWRLETVSEGKVDTSTIESKQNHYLELLEDSVHMQLMSDVPLGIFLSGGIDSSLISSLAAKRNQDIHCFTVVEKSTYMSKDVEQARKVTSALNLPFYPILFDLDELASGFTLKDFENQICLMESPRFDPEWLFKSELHRAAKDLVPELKVILLGQGADEFTGGYSRELGSHWENWNDYIAGEVTPSLLDKGLHDYSIPDRFSLNISEDMIRNYSFSPYVSKMFFFVNQLQFFNLWHEDRTSSYHSIESRVPYLDHRIIEFLAQIPEDQHEELFWDKKIVREALAKTFPEYPGYHEKVPFFAGKDISSINKFLRTICLNIFEEFSMQYLQKNSLFRPDEFENIISDLKAGKRYHDAVAWKLIELMSISVFDRYIKNPEAYLFEGFFSRKKCLPVVKEEDWPELEQRYNQSGNDQHGEWDLDSIVTIPEDFSIYNPLTEPEGKTDLMLCLNENNNLKISINDDNYWVIMLLDEMGRHLDEPKTLGYWAEKVEKTPQDIVNLFHNLVEGGFLYRVI